MFTRQRALGALAGLAATVAAPAVVRSATQAVSVGQIGQSIAFFPLFVADHEGYFKDAGLDVTLTALNSGSLVGTAVTSNSIDIGCSVITDVFALIKANRPVKVVGSLVNGYYIDIVMNEQFLAATKLTRQSPLADRIQALKGKKLGITAPGSGNQALVEYLFDLQNLDPSRDVELVNVGTDQAAILAAMKTNRIDGASFAWPLSFLAQSQNIGRPLIMPALGDVPSMRDQIQGVMYVKPDMLTKRSDAVKAFVHAIARAEALLHRDRSKARSYVKLYAPALDEPTIDALFGAYLPVLPTQPAIIASSYLRALEFHERTGFATPAGTAYTDVVDAPLILEAQR